MPRRNLIWVVSVVLVSLLSWQRTPGAGRGNDDFEFYRTFVDALDRIERSYYEKVDRNQLREWALQGMLSNLDPYSSYIPPGNAPGGYANFEETTQGHLKGGIGVQVGKEGRGPLVVISPMVGSPAYRGGVLAGDRIIEIEGMSTENISFDEAVVKLKGMPNTQVTISLVHEGKTDSQQITLTREEIKIESVMGDVRKPDNSWDWIIDKPNKIAYIRATGFIQTTADDLDRAVRAAKDDGMTALVLDLRMNPGGLLNSAIDVSNMFLKSGKIVSTKGRDTEPRGWSADSPGAHTDFPMAILVNHFSASASEIVAAALQDNSRAKIVGERTWGKGSVQNVIELEGGKSALKLTTAEYQRPNGHNIHRHEKSKAHEASKDSDEWGVMPSDGLEVKLSGEELGTMLRWRRDRDIVRSQKPADGDAKPGDVYADKQLQKAIENVITQLKDAKSVSQK